MKIISFRLITVSFPHLRLKPFDIPKFRGYLSNKYPNYTLIHNHLESGKLRYAYPLIQFKVIDTHPTIIGVGEGINILKQQVRRNSSRFPKDFLFELSEKEIEFLVSQNVIPGESALGGVKPVVLTGNYFVNNS